MAHFKCKPLHLPVHQERRVGLRHASATEPGGLPYPVPALVQSTKQGDLYVLDRRTGQPLHQVAERPAPQGGVEPAERAPTQKHSLYNTTQ